MTASERDEWIGVALEYAQEYGEIRAREEARDEADREAGIPVMRPQPAYRARAPFRACYEALKEAGYERAQILSNLEKFEGVA